MRCRVSLLLTFLALVLGTSLRAHIGETEPQLVARYGAVEGRLPARILEAGRVFTVGERLTLKQREWRVTAVLIGGHCAKITYMKRGQWTEQHYQDLLGANTGQWTWQEIVGGASKWQRTWRRADGLVAKWMYAGGFVIEAQTYVDAREQARHLATQELPVAVAP